MITASQESVIPGPIVRDGAARITDYVGRWDRAGDGPQAFLMEGIEPGWVIPPHFHFVDQFQVVVGGSGAIGRHELAPVSVHYADGSSPYGPIVSGAESIAFFTIRATAETGGQPMPGSRDLLRGKPGRNVTAQFDTRRPPGGAVAGTLLEFPDGVRATGLWSSDGCLRLPPPHGPGTRFVLIASGRARCAGQELPPRSVIALTADEALPAIEATEETSALLLEFRTRP